MTTLPTKAKDLVKRLQGLATLRQHAINTMPMGFMSPMQAKATADIGTLTEAAAVIAEMGVELERLTEVLAEVDDVLDLYGIDTVGTGSHPPVKEQTRVDRIVDAAVERQIVRRATLASPRNPDDKEPR
jgi:hypothetical protein